MNIIVTNDKTVRLTQYDATDSTPIDIQNIRVHLGFNLTPAHLKLVCKEAINDIDFKVYSYTIALTAVDDPLTPNYIDYKCFSSYTIPTKNYHVTLILDDNSAIEIGDINITNDNINDQHPYIVINPNRSITDNSTNTLLQEDSLSQVIRFQIDEYYDGISFLDESKDIYVDYIPPKMYADEGETATFLSDRITKREKDPQIPGKIILHWLVPPRVARDAGSVTYAISVVNYKQAYVWQTLTAKLSVLPNIGKRPYTPVIPDIPVEPDTPGGEGGEVDAELLNRVARLENFVENIDYVSNINSETGEITYTQRENGVETNITHEVDDLYATSAKNTTTVINGGGANL